MAANSEDSPHFPFHKPGIREKTFFLISGALVSVPFTLFFAQFYSLLPIIWSAVVFAPFVEELSKVYPLFYRHGETQRSLVVLGVLVGLGFGITELILYVVVFGAPFVSRLPGVIFHASSAGIAAFGIAKKNPLPYFLLSVLLHLINNLVTFSGILPLSLLVQIVVLISAYLLVWHFYHKASDQMVVM